MSQRKKVNWKRVVLWSLVAVLVIGISGLFAVNYAANKVIESMSASLESDLTSSSLTVTPSSSDSTVKPEQSASPNAKPDTNPSASNQPKGQVVTHNQQQDKPGVYAPQVSTDKAKAIKEKVTISEKTTVTSILMGHLNMDDLNKFKEMASGGMTVDEKREARKILLSKLSPEEYNKLVGIAKKYGVSQGKTYTQAKQEEANATK